MSEPTHICESCGTADTTGNCDPGDVCPECWRKTIERIAAHEEE